MHPKTLVVRYRRFFVPNVQDEKLSEAERYLRGLFGAVLGVPTPKHEHAEPEAEPVPPQGPSSAAPTERTLEDGRPELDCSEDISGDALDRSHDAPEEEEEVEGRGATADQVRRVCHSDPPLLLGLPLPVCPCCPSTLCLISHAAFSSLIVLSGQNLCSLHALPLSQCTTRQKTLSSHRMQLSLGDAPPQTLPEARSDAASPSQHSQRKGNPQGGMTSAVALTAAPPQHLTGEWGPVRVRVVRENAPGRPQAALTAPSRVGQKKEGVPHSPAGLQFRDIRADQVIGVPPLDLRPTEDSPPHPQRGDTDGDRKREGADGDVEAATSGAERDSAVLAGGRDSRGAPSSSSEAEAPSLAGMGEGEGLQGDLGPSGDVTAGSRGAASRPVGPRWDGEASGAWPDAGRGRLGDKPGGWGMSAAEGRSAAEETASELARALGHLKDFASTLAAATEPLSGSIGQVRKGVTYSAVSLPCPLGAPRPGADPDSLISASPTTPVVSVLQWRSIGMRDDAAQGAGTEDRRDSRDGGPGRDRLAGRGVGSAEGGNMAQDEPGAWRVREEAEPPVPIRDYTPAPTSAVQEPRRRVALPPELALAVERTLDNVRDAMQGALPAVQQTAASRCLANTGTDGPPLSFVS